MSTIQVENSPIREIGIPYGSAHECVSGHLHSIHPAQRKCPKCSKIHDHPYYLETSEGYVDCPKVPHLTPAAKVNRIKAVKGGNLIQSTQGDSEW